MEINLLGIDELLPYANNAREHSEDQIKHIANSIQEFGFNNPILIDKNKQVIAGHGRLLAAQHLELKEVPCIRLEHLSEAQKKAYILADNKLAELAYWNWDLLGAELKELEELNIDIQSLGFEKLEIKQAVTEPEDSSQEIDLDEFEKFDNKCPKCGFEFDDKA